MKIKKRVFGIPIGKWLKDDLRDYLFASLSKKKLNAHNFFDDQTVNFALNNHLKGFSDNTNKLWSIIQLIIGMKTIFNKKILYLTINGVLEPLIKNHRCQIILLSYLKIINFILYLSKKRIFFIQKITLCKKEIFSQNNISWYPLKYYSFKKSSSIFKYFKIIFIFVSFIIFKKVKIIHIKFNTRNICLFF